MTTPRTFYISLSFKKVLYSNIHDSNRTIGSQTANMPLGSCHWMSAWSWRGKSLSCLRRCSPPTSICFRYIFKTFSSQFKVPQRVWRAFRFLPAHLHQTKCSKVGSALVTVCTEHLKWRIAAYVETISFKSRLSSPEINVFETWKIAPSLEDEWKCKVKNPCHEAIRKKHDFYILIST